MTEPDDEQITMNELIRSRPAAERLEALRSRLFGPEPDPPQNPTDDMTAPDRAQTGEHDGPID